MPASGECHLDDPCHRAARAEVIAGAESWCTVRETVFSLGGGQTCDRGHVVALGEVIPVSAIRADEREAKCAS